MEQSTLHTEFKKQVANLIQLGYPAAGNLSESEFIELVKPLERQIEVSSYEIDIENGTLPFAIVVSHKLVSTEFAMTKIVKDGKVGVVKLYPHTSNDFEPIAEVEIPEEYVYLVADIDRGKENISLPPNEALALITKENRSPLTIDEGVAIVTQYPEFLIKNNCFSLLASRKSRDKRVPAIWINAKKQPNLGWCWDGNPHTWLGSASCNKRVAAKV